MPDEDWTVLDFEDEETAFAKCRELNEKESLRRMEEEDYNYTSVLASRSNHYSYGVYDTATPKPYPETTPHYE